MLMEVVGDAADSGRVVDTLKVFRSFSMETIMATAFGRAIDIQRGEADSIAQAAASIFGDMKGNTFLEAFLFSMF